MLTYESDHDEIVTQINAPMRKDSPNSIPIAIRTGWAIPTFGRRNVMNFEKQNKN